jgi:hypothetical protein
MARSRKASVSTPIHCEPRQTIPIHAKDHVDGDGQTGQAQPPCVSQEQANAADRGHAVQGKLKLPSLSLYNPVFQSREKHHG